MADQFQVLILNNVSQNGLKRLPAERFVCAKEVAKPDAVLLNFSREGVVDEASVLAALEAKKLATYV
ncbi:MAG: hypothetical protein HZC24_03065, partial [Rhodocyclales bacterium]|nr:hypothetical protein [Rhodocyclales bacterium]